MGSYLEMGSLQAECTFEEASPLGPHPNVSAQDMRAEDCGHHHSSRGARVMVPGPVSQHGHHEVSGTEPLQTQTWCSHCSAAWTSELEVLLGTSSLRRL